MHIKDFDLNNEKKSLIKDYSWLKTKKRLCHADRVIKSKSNWNFHDVFSKQIVRSILGK